jgi:RNase adapter protein RapZ
MTQQSENDVLIVTGMSGAGRSTAANALEDLGWYVVDNLPPQMLQPLIDVAMSAESGIRKVACVVDVRGGKLFEYAREAMIELAKRTNVQIMYLDATDDVLVRRFEQVRRPHPLQGEGTLLEGISQERQLMQEVRERSDIVIDSSELNLHQLSTVIADRFHEGQTPGISLTVVSFGFKYGLPTDVDMVWDMRFIANPYWEPELKSLTGTDSAVSDYVLNQDGVAQYLDLQLDALRIVLDGYRKENKRFATLAIGCTGGKHRSVATAEKVASRLAEIPGAKVSVRHRDAGRE